MGGFCHGPCIWKRDIFVFKLSLQVYAFQNYLRIQSVYTVARLAFVCQNTFVSIFTTFTLYLHGSAVTLSQ